MRPLGPLPALVTDNTRIPSIIVSFPGKYMFQVISKWELYRVLCNPPLNS